MKLNLYHLLFCQHKRYGQVAPLCSECFKCSVMVDFKQVKNWHCANNETSRHLRRTASSTVASLNAVNDIVADIRIGKDRRADLYDATARLIESAVDLSDSAGHVASVAANELRDNAQRAGIDHTGLFRDIPRHYSLPAHCRKP